MILKNFYDKNVPTKNLVSTITGIVSLLISALVLFGVIKSDQAATLTQLATMIVTGVAGIIGMFFTVDAKV